MIHVGEDLLLCDMAETYHVYITDWELLPFPLSFIANLAAGLKDDSRIKKKMANVRMSLSETLEALIVDKLSILIWQKTKDGVKGRNAPESVYKKLAGIDEKQKDELLSFRTAEDFDRWYKNKMR